MTTITTRATMLSLALALLVPGTEAGAQWVRSHEQFYLQAPHNWKFRDQYMSADRLFNAFDYGHAILYEKLYRYPGASPDILEVDEYDRLTKKILVKPPRVPLEEGAIEIQYVKLAPEAKQMFEWAHILHRQVYDVLADESLSEAQRDAEVARLLAYYRSRSDVAFSSKPKTMALMQEQPYSLAFRQKYPKFNGLIWAYHWLQVGLYEPLLVGKSVDEKQSLVRATVARFWQMLGSPPASMPHQMPMTAAVAPQFAARYPEAAIIFDNLHSMHDVISDILANPSVPRDRKRAEILLAAERFRDDTSYVMSREAWLAMTHHMGIENMGGPSVGFLPALPSPTVTYGAVMLHDDATGEMTGFAYGGPVGDAHAGHGAATEADSSDDPHAGHDMAPDSSHATMMMEMHMRLLSDPVIRQRIQSDSVMLEMAEMWVNAAPEEHREHMRQLLDGPPEPAPQIQKDAPARAAGPQPRAVPARKPAPAKQAAPAKKEPPAAKKPDPHAGHKPDPHAGHKPGSH